MTKQQRLVLVVSILASFVAFLDSAIVNVALPSMQSDLGGGLSAQQWVVDAYMLTLGSFILIAGSLSDLFGRKKILNLGLLGFGVASLLCAIAPSSEFLIGARALQGVAGALLVPSSLALIIATFSGTAQGKAIGSWTAWTGIAFIIGPLLGGILVDSSSWRWIFAINILPIAITLYLLKGVTVPKREKTAKPSVDILGTVLCALGLGGAVFALIEQPRYGWGDPLIYLPLVTGILLLIGFILHENRIKNPMLPLSLFRNHNFSVGNVATLAIYAGLAAGMFLVVLFLQQVSGYSALEAGLSLLPVTLILFLLSSRVGALSAKIGPRLFMGFGPLIAGAGFLMMLGMPADVNYWTQLFPGIIVFGLGLALTVAPLTATILGDVAKEQAGIASAINNAVARIAGLLAIAAVGAIVAAQFSSSIDHLNQGYFSKEDVAIIKQVPLQIKPDISDTEQSEGSAIGEFMLIDASVSAFHAGILSVAVLIMAGGVISLIGIRNPSRVQ
jgi:EmrB/QacA subfamily drug resistance transporter